MEETSNVLFSIGPVEITGTIVTMWVIMAILVVLSILATRNMKDVPGPLQNLAEQAVGKLHGYYEGILGPKVASKYFPVLATLFIFIIVSNYSGLIPGAGHYKAFKVPTANLSVTAALAIIGFFTIHTVGVKERGVGGYLKSFLSVMLPLTIVEQFVRPFSLALRLFGNLYGEEMVTEQLYGIFPILVPILMNVLSLLFCLIQALVFTMLLSIYISEAAEEE
jgi:F-type H+-transporting ATPase subunit a